jgi:hypothetical protein
MRFIHSQIIIATIVRTNRTLRGAPSLPTHCISRLCPQRVEMVREYIQKKVYAIGPELSFYIFRVHIQASVQLSIVHIRYTSIIEIYCLSDTVLPRLLRTFIARLAIMAQCEMSPAILSLSLY